MRRKAKETKTHLVDGVGTVVEDDLVEVLSGRPRERDPGSDAGRVGAPLDRLVTLSVGDVAAEVAVDSSLSERVWPLGGSLDRSGESQVLAGSTVGGKVREGSQKREGMVRT